MEKSQTNAINVTLHLLIQTIWRDIWKHTAEISQTNETSVILHLHRKTLWFENPLWRKAKQMQPMWLCVHWVRFQMGVENAQWKHQTNAMSVTLHSPRQAIWGFMLSWIVRLPVGYSSFFHWNWLTQNVPRKYHGIFHFPEKLCHFPKNISLFPKPVFHFPNKVLYHVAQNMDVHCTRVLKNYLLGNLQPSAVSSQLHVGPK